MNELQTITSTNPASVYIASLAAESGRRTQAQALRAIANILGFDDPLAVNWAALRYEHTAAIRTALISKYSPATINTRMFSALRGTLKQAWLLGQMTADDYQKAIQLKPVTGETLPAGRYIEPEEVLAMLATCDSSPKGLRDATVIITLYMVGVRRFELSALTLSDYDPKTGKITIRKGKRNKERFDFLPPEAREKMDAWLSVRGNRPGPVFLPVRDNAVIWRQDIDPQSIYNWWEERREAAKIPPCSPHSARRSNASNMLIAGIDALVIAKSKGWANVNTLRIYDLRTEQAQYEAAQRLTLQTKAS